MLEIKKSREPLKLIKYKKQAGSSYEEMDHDVKKELLESLLKEQGYLCAYCTRRIPEKSVPGVTIEHWNPRNPQEGYNQGQDLDYRNMFAVCMGNRGCDDIKNTTCDAHRGNTPLKINPTMPDTLKDIGYSHDGTIYSKDPKIDKDIKDTLNLNCESVSLPQNRKEVLNKLIKKVSEERGSVNDIASYCRKLLKKIEGTQDHKIPYIGIAIWWLKKHS